MSLFVGGAQPKGFEGLGVLGFRGLGYFKGRGFRVSRV